MSIYSAQFGSSLDQRLQLSVRRLGTEGILNCLLGAAEVPMGAHNGRDRLKQQFKPHSLVEMPQQANGMTFLYTYTLRESMWRHITPASLMSGNIVVRLSMAHVRHKPVDVQSCHHRCIPPLTMALHATCPLQTMPAHMP